MLTAVPVGFRATPALGGPNLHLVAMAFFSNVALSSSSAPSAHVISMAASVSGDARVLSAR